MLDHSDPGRLFVVENGVNGTKLSSKIAAGNQPVGGSMTLTLQKRNLGGYPDCDTIMIEFEFKDGTQMVRLFVLYH